MSMDFLFESSQVENLELDLIQTEMTNMKTYCMYLCQWQSWDPYRTFYKPTEFFWVRTKQTTYE